MKYWCYTTVNNLEQVQQRTLEYLTTSGILEQSKKAQGFMMLPKMEQHVPELINLRDDFRFLGASAYIMWDNSAGLPHRDTTRSRARINIPILNCANTITEFWQCRHEESRLTPDLQAGNGLPYRGYSWDQIELQTAVCIDQPTVIRVQEIHSIRILGDQVPRITLTVKFWPDVDCLLEA